MRTMTWFISIATIACAGLLVGCAASAPPDELVKARQAYQQASAGQAAQLVPAELHKAQEALAAAEKAFQDEPKSVRTRDLAYVADRKAKTAEALATTAAGTEVTVKLRNETVGHMTPSGMPHHRLRLVTNLFDEEGKVVATAEERFERVLGDGKGRPLTTPAEGRAWFNRVGSDSAW